MRKGFTVIEIIVALGILSVVILLTVSTFTQVAYRSFQNLSTESMIQTEATANLDRVSKYLRGASSIIQALDQSMTFMAFSDEQATISSKTRFFLSGRNFLQGTIPPTGSGPNYTYNPANEKIYTLTTKISASPGTIFTYYDNNGNLLSSPVATGSVTLVKVALPYKPDNLLRPGPLYFSSEIQLRNLKTNL